MTKRRMWFWVTVGIVGLSSVAWGLSGDLDRDGDVDFDDFFLFSDDFGKTGPVETECGPTEPAPLPAVFEGNGTQLTDAFTLEEGLRVFRVELPTTEGIIVELIDGQTGEWIELLFAESPAEGEGQRQLSTGIAAKAGSYRLQVKLIGTPWTITVE